VDEDADRIRLAELVAALSLGVDLDGRGGAVDGGGHIRVRGDIKFRR
jgi:hypothetical protein